MQVLTSITQKGQITIPKHLRDKYKLEEYGKVTIEEGTDHIKIRPTQDILELAGSVHSVEGKSTLQARGEMEKRYKQK